MFAPAVASSVVDFTLVFGGASGAIVLLALFTAVSSALIYGIIKNGQWKSKRSSHINKNDNKAELEGLLPCC